MVVVVEVQEKFEEAGDDHKYKVDDISHSKNIPENTLSQLEGSSSTALITSSSSPAPVSPTDSEAGLYFPI